MARIRTIKPEVAAHEGLFDLEQETKLPIRFAWCLLFTVADREGRFVWRARTLKAQILPHDECDFSRVLDAWLTRGFVVKYRVGNEWFGVIPTFTKHQVINNRESASDLPGLEDADEVIDHRNQQVMTREPRVDDASLSREVHAQAEGKERKEGKARVVDALTLPDWVPQEPWSAWLEVRKKLKVPNTNHALKLAITDLERFKATGQDPAAVLNEATKRGWKGLWPLKDAESNSPRADL